MRQWRSLRVPGARRVMTLAAPAQYSTDPRSTGRSVSRTSFPHSYPGTPTWGGASWSCTDYRADMARRRAYVSGVSLRCRGCTRTATADQFSATQLAEMLSWHRAPDGDWCVECQWKRDRTPRFVARVYGDMDRRRFARDPVEREKVESIWASVRRYGG